uniref:(northern house mosquito) hypothetical protein n=1 Tax=Culex pipiens TaxID=7175 RepID=A0A8D7ZZT1_CULPI
MIVTSLDTRSVVEIHRRFRLDTSRKKHVWQRSDLVLSEVSYQVFCLGITTLTNKLQVAENRVHRIWAAFEQIHHRLHVGVFQFNHGVHQSVDGKQFRAKPGEEL